MENKGEKLRKLFFSTFYLSAFTFGGGYVIVSLMKKKFVDEYHWLNEDEMLDLVAIAQSAPGPIAVNGAIVIGYRLMGIIGSIVAILATILPPFVIITIISLCYEIFIQNQIIALMLQGMQVGVGAVIFNVVFDMSKQIKGYFSWIILILSFIASYIFEINVAYIILVCILIGIVQSIMGVKNDLS